MSVSCEQCGKPALYELAGHPLCLGCFAQHTQIVRYDQQQRQEQRAAVRGASENNWQRAERATGLKIPRPSILVPQEAPQSLQQGVQMFNYINISNSNIGLLNTGAISDIQRIEVNLALLDNSSQHEVKEALAQLTEAVAASADLDAEKRTEALDQLEELSRQATLRPEERSRPGTLKALLQGAAQGMSAAGGLAKAWETWGPKLMEYFGG